MATSQRAYRFGRLTWIRTWPYSGGARQTGPGGQAADHDQPGKTAQRDPSEHGSKSVSHEVVDVTGATAAKEDVAKRLDHLDGQAGLVLTFDGPFDEPGRATVIGGYPATLNETPKFPGLCLEVQGHDVCVSAESDDTGPYPDRSAERPVMTALAKTLRFPVDIEDHSSWLPAQEVFG